MPYDPHVQYDQGRPIAAGISTAIGRWLEFAGMLKNEADQTKSLRTTLTEIEPAKKDVFGQMTRAELQGYAGAQTLKTQQAGALLQQQLQQQQLAEAKRRGEAETAMTEAMRVAQGPGGGVNPMAPGQPGAPSVGGSGVSPTALMNAMAANPASVNTDAGRGVLSQFMKDQGDWNLQPTDTRPVAGGRYQFVPVSKGSATVVPNANEGAVVDTTKPPKMFDVGGGRKGYYVPGANGTQRFTVMPTGPARQMPSAVAATLTQVEMQMANVMTGLAKPGLSAKEKAALESDRDRYAAQIDRIKSDWLATPADAVAGGAADYIFKDGQLVPAANN